MKTPRLTLQNENDRFVTPEGVPLRLELATIGSRFGAQMIDLLITYGGILAIIFLAAWLNLLDLSSFITILSLLLLFVRLPYYVLTEYLWNGSTIGKKVLKLQVVSADGTHLTPHQIFTRNIMKEVEIFIPATQIIAFSDFGLFGRSLTLLWLVVLLIVMLRSRRKQRIGDMAAGTLVIQKPRPVFLPDMATKSVSGMSMFQFSEAQLDIYGRHELQALEAILREADGSPLRREEQLKVAEAIAKKIGFSQPVTRRNAHAFLSEFYREQRAQLETKQLFGERRENKFHATQSPDHQRP